MATQKKSDYRFLSCFLWATEAVLRLPGEGTPLDEDANPLTALDRAFGGVEDDADEFRDHLKGQSRLEKTKLILLQADEVADLKEQEAARTAQM